VPEQHPPRGLIDTSVLIDLERIDRETLPDELAISAGPHATDDPAERALRQDRLQRAEATFDPMPVDTAVARAFGRIYAAITAKGRKARGRRALDLLIAATALASDLPIYTRNAEDFEGLAELLDVHPVETPAG
jgi:predicted nucleic acid-binding protein